MKVGLQGLVGRTNGWKICTSNEEEDACKWFHFSSHVPLHVHFFLHCGERRMEQGSRLLVVAGAIRLSASNVASSGLNPG